MIQLDKIRTVTFEATSFCNLHCPQCPRFDQEGFLQKDLQPDHLNFDNFTRNFDLTLLPNIDTVLFEGDYGDFIMHPDAYKFLLFFESVPKLQVVTNGSLRSPRWWAELSKIKNLSVTFSIDGLQDTNHIYRINSKFDTIINNARSFIQAGGIAEWKYIVFAHNEHQIDEAREFSKELGFSTFTPVPTNRNWWNGDTWAVKIDGEYQYDIQKSKSINMPSKRKSVIALEKIKKNINVDPDTKLKIDSITEQQVKSKCWLTHGDLYINHMGHVLPCCMTSGQTWQKNIVGKLWQRLVGNIDEININKTNLKDIIDSNFYQQNLSNSFKSSKTIHPTCISHCS